MLTKQEMFLGRDARADSSRVMEPRRTALPPRLPTLAFMVMGLSFPVVFSQSF